MVSPGALRPRRGAPPALHLRFETLVVEGVDTSGWSAQAHLTLAEALRRELHAQLADGAVNARRLQAALAHQTVWQLPAAQLPAGGTPSPDAVGVALARSLARSLPSSPTVAPSSAPGAPAVSNGGGRS